MRSLLRGVTGKARRQRARWIVDLGELQHLALPARTWVGLDRRTGAGDWSRVWMRDRASTAVDTPRHLAHDLQALLRRELGLELLIETPEGEQEMRIHVAAPDLVRLVRVELRDALVVLGERPPEEAPHPSVLRRDYAPNALRLRGLALASGLSRHAVTKMIPASARLERGQAPVELTRPREVVALARARALAGASLRALARLLGCSRRTAGRFRRRTRQVPGTG